MVTAAGRAKILDFGLAKIYRGATEKDISTPGRRGRHLPCDVTRAGAGADDRSPLRSVLVRERCSTRWSPASRPSTPPARPRHWRGSARTSRNRSCAHRSSSAAGAGGADAPIAQQVPGATTSKQRGRRRRPRADRALRRARAHVRRGASPTWRRRATSTHLAGKTSQAARSAQPAAAHQQRAASDDGPLLRSGRQRQRQPDRGVSQPFDPETLYELMLQLRPLAQAVAQRHEGTAGPRRWASDAHLLRLSARARRRCPASGAGGTGSRVRGGRTSRQWLGQGSCQACVARRHSHRSGGRVGQSRTLQSRSCSAPRSMSRCRLQASAAPGTVVISPATRSLVQRGFTTEALAPLPPSAGSASRLVPYRVREGQRRRRGRCVRPRAHGRAGARAGPADESVGAGPRRERAGGPLQRGARYRQVAIAARAPRAASAKAAATVRCGGSRSMARPTRRTRRCTLS